MKPEYVVGGLLILFLVGGTVVLLAPSKSEQRAAPSHLVCYPLDITGWKPMTRVMREAVAGGRIRQAIEVQEFDSLDCVERNPKNKRIGEVVETRRMEWWRPVEKERKRNVIKH